MDRQQAEARRPDSEHIEPHEMAQIHDQDSRPQHAIKQPSPKTGADPSASDAGHQDE